MQLHDILQLRTSVILREAILDGGLAPTTDTSLFLTTYRGGSHLPSDIRKFFKPRKQGIKKACPLDRLFRLFVESCKKVILKFRSISDTRILHSYLFVKLKKVICEIKKNEQ